MSAHLQGRILPRITKTLICITMHGPVTAVNVHEGSFAEVRMPPAAHSRCGRCVAYLMEPSSFWHSLRACIRTASSALVQGSLFFTSGSSMLT